MALRTRHNPTPPPFLPTASKNNNSNNDNNNNSREEEEEDEDDEDDDDDDDDEDSSSSSNICDGSGKKGRRDGKALKNIQSSMSHNDHSSLGIPSRSNLAPKLMRKTNNE